MNLNDIIPATVWGIPGGIFLLAVCTMALITVVILLVAWQYLELLHKALTRRAERRARR